MTRRRSVCIRQLLPGLIFGVSAQEELKSV
jgi:hypothetical protein